MPAPVKQALKEEYNRLKKVFKKILTPQKEATPQLVLQPYRNKKKF